MNILRPEFIYCLANYVIYPCTLHVPVGEKQQHSQSKLYATLTNDIIQLTDIYMGMLNMKRIIVSFRRMLAAQTAIKSQRRLDLLKSFQNIFIASR